MSQRTVRVVLEAATGPYEAGMKRAAKATDDVAQAGEQLPSAFQRGTEAAGKLATAMGAVGIAATAVGAAAVKSFADFDSAMSGVSAANLSASADELDQLREAALKLGADTAFSATEAAQGIENLARAGVETADILGGGLDGALSLAAAGQLEVAEAAEIASIAMTQFKLAGEDVPHVADLLAAGAGKAMGDVDDFGQALKQSGLVASQFGLSIEETVGGLSAFASAGLLGSDAGTSLKAMLLALANPAGKTAQTMRDLGIEAYDAQGKFIGLEGLAGELRDSMSGLDDATRQQALAQIFGNDAIRAASILYEEGADGIAQWTESVDDAGYAAEQASRLQDNLKGDLEKLGGAWDTLAIQMGSAADGPLRAVVQALDNLLTGIAKIPGGAETIMILVTALGGLAIGAAGLVKATTTIAEFTTALKTLGATEAQLGKVSGALGMLGRAIPVAGVLTAVAAGAIALNEAFTPIPATADEVARAVEGAAEAASEWDKVMTSDTEGRWMADPLANIDSMEEALTRLAKIPKEERSIFHSDQYEDLQAIEDQLLKVDSAIQGMSGDKAAKSMSSLVTMMKKAGVESDEISRLLPQAAKQAEEALYKMSLAGADVQVNAQGVADVLAGDLPEGIVWTTEGLMTLHEATQKGLEGFNQFGEEVAQALVATEEVAAATQTAADTYSDFSARSEMLRAAAESASVSMDGQVASAEDVAKAIADAEQAYANLIGEIAASDAAFINIGGAIEKFTDGAKFNLDGYLKALEEQVEAQRNWESNMILLAGRVSEATLDELRRLGPEGAPLVASLVDASAEELARLEASFGQAGAEATGAFAEELVNARAVWSALAATAGMGAVAAAQAEIAAGKTTLSQVIADYNLNFDVGADTNPALRDARAAAAKIDAMRAVIRVNAMLTGNPAAMYAAGMYGRAGGGLIGDRGEFHLAGGGMLRGIYSGRLVEGPGTVTSDSIPARLSRGEFVQPERAVDYYGAGFMYALRDKRIPREMFAAMGFAGGGSPAYEFAPSMRHQPSWQYMPQRGQLQSQQASQITQTNHITESHKPELTARVLGERLMGVMGR